MEKLNIKALIFDGFGTLFNLESAAPIFELAIPGKGLEFLHWWRQRQLALTRQCILTRRYRNLRVLMDQAMEEACKHFQVDIPLTTKEDLCAQYHRLELFPEVQEVLDILHPKYKLVLLSHGTQEMLNAVVAHNKLTSLLDAVLSVDMVQAYKPELKAYELATKTLNLPESAFGYAGVNPADIAGAKAFGMKTIWVHRNMPESQLMSLITNLNVIDLRKMATEH
ncbi:MAG: haloacid dehalogenase type II [Anaerolineales bacterium]